jgi:hypothetical protein
VSTERHIFMLRAPVSVTEAHLLLLFFLHTKVGTINQLKRLAQSTALPQPLYSLRCRTDHSPLDMLKHPGLSLST